MSITQRNIKLLLRQCIFRLKCSNYSTKQSRDIRREFLDFFINENGHKFVRSSPVVPFCDPTVPFVNAGMNQFKEIFMGKFSPPHPRVANSQKCVRVSGKHNDIDVIGSDGHHHTFFEMLGNWSFGDYYKEDACRMAWQLLTGPFGFNKNDLVITYFGGDQSLNLPADLECKNVWLNLGVHPDNIKPLNLAENFWEMGSTGPCGPCTEIHYRDGSGQLMEIWNLVFIQFHRNSDGKIVSLPKCHVDTGMGLERITALLQNKKSNYDTDLFMPIINTIHKESGKVSAYQGKFGSDADLDIAYRILSDHARMISVCLADGVFPCRNLRLRNILRRALTMSRNVFQCQSGLLLTLYDRIAEILGDTYPELLSKMNNAKQIISHEENTLAILENTMKKDRKVLTEKYPETRDLTTEMLPGLLEGYKQFKDDLKKRKGETMSGRMAFKLYDTFGLNEDVIAQIAQINKLTIDVDSFKTFLADHKSKHKAVFTKSVNASINNILNVDALHRQIPLTDDSHKYKYDVVGDRYTFPKLNSKLIAVITEDGKSEKTIDVVDKRKYHLIFDKTNFYCEEGGQEQDSGDVEINNLKFTVNSVSSIRGYVIHTGTFNASGAINVGDDAVLAINDDRRFSMMQHHTATHLLNAVVKYALPDSVTCQLGSRVNSSGLTLDLAIYGNKLTIESIRMLNAMMRELCSRDMKINTRIIDAQELLSYDNVTTVPGEVYPDTGLRFVEMNSAADQFASRELCCGTHVASTRDIVDFSITSIRGAGGHAPIIRAVVGKLAKQLKDLRDEASKLLKDFDDNEISDHETINERIKKIKTKLNEICKGDGAPFDLRLNCLEILASIERRMKEEDEKAITELVTEEMGTLDTSGKNYITHFLACSYLLQPGTLSLNTAVQYAPEKPILVMGCASGILKATCQVPPSFATDNFNAETWMNSILPVFETHILPPVKNQNIRYIAHMKGKKVSLINCEALVLEAIEKGNEFASLHCPKLPQNQGIQQKSNKC